MMKKIFFIFFILSINSNAQIYKYNKVFNDSLVFKNFNQGYIDAQKYFIATNDYLLGLISIPTYSIPSTISYFIPPKNIRLKNNHNPNNKYLDINKRGNIFQQEEDVDFTFNNIISNNDYLMIKGSNATGLNSFTKKIIKGN